MAEAYYLSGDPVMSLNYLRLVDSSINLQSDDPALIYLLAELFQSILINMYIILVNNRYFSSLSKFPSLSTINLFF